MTAASLQSVSVYEVNSTVEDATTDTELIFTGSEIEVGFADQAAFVEGKDYTVKVLKAGTDNAATAPGVAVREAGKYIAYLTGMGQYAGETKEVSFEVKPFALSNANQVTVDDVVASDSAPANPSKVTVGAEGTAGYAELDPSLVSLKFKSDAAGNDDVLFNKPGAYKFTFSVDPSNANITWTVAESQNLVDVHKVAAHATYKYGDEVLVDSYSVNLAKKESFDLGKIAAYNGDTKATYSVSATDADGNNKTSGELTAGVWTVTVKVDAASNSHKVGGTKTITVKVVDDVVDADANVFVYLKSSKEAVDSISKIYDGVAIEADHYEAKAFGADGKEISDDTLDVQLRDADGKTVSTVSDAGEYTLVVVSKKLELTGTTEIPVTIEKVDLSTLKVNSVTDHFGAPYLPLESNGYSYSKLDLRFDTHVADSDNNDKASDKEGWDSLAYATWGSKTKYEMFDEEKGEWVAVAPGKFEGVLRITLSGTEADAKNYKFANDDNTTTVEVLVADEDKLVFNDVKPGDWFFDVVFDAQANGWMNGYADGVLFGAHDQITRGQVACVLFNMAGADMNETDGSYNEVFGWKSFDDVDGKAYYGEAIAWAKQAGVVNGYGDGTFAPDAPVTREELACMLANYAKKVDQADVSVEDADKVLSSMSDGSAVSAWAKGSVAWAVENEIMGNAGFVNSGAEITRAETAAMVVNYMA